MLHSMGQAKWMTPYWLRRLGVAPQEATVLSAMLEKKINIVWSSGVGRLFDAVAALVVPMAEATFEGEAAMRLEALADPNVENGYELPLRKFDALPAGNAAVPRGDWRPMVASIVEDLERGAPPGVIAARFHNALVAWAANCVKIQRGIPVALAGGCFQNRFLTERLAERLRATGRECFTPGLIPTGDGGLAVGQLAVAMARLNDDGCPRKGAT